MTNRKTKITLYQDSIELKQAVATRNTSLKREMYLPYLKIHEAHHPNDHRPDQLSANERFHSNRSQHSELRGGSKSETNYQFSQEFP